MNKLLILTTYWDPEQTASSYLIENLNDAFVVGGIQTVVYTPTPTRSISKEVRKAYAHRRTEIQADGMRIVHRFPLYSEGRNVALRALRYLLASICQFGLALFHKDARRCDVLYAVSTPPIQGAMAALVKMVRGIPPFSPFNVQCTMSPVPCSFVYGLQDIFPDSLVSTGIAKKGGLVWKLGRVIENFTYRHADKIIVISEGFKRNIMAKGVPEEKIEVVYNWVDQQTVVPVQRNDNILFHRYALDRSAFYLCYAGNIGMTQNMDLLLEVMEELQTEEPHIRLVLVGEGVYKQSIKEIITDRQLHNVHLLPFQPYQDIAHVFSMGDVGLVISKVRVGANSLPSKTWNIMAAARAVIANFDNDELQSIIEQNNCGIFTPAGDKTAFKKAVLSLYQDRRLCQQMGRNGRQFIMDNLTKEAGTKKYVDIFNSF